MRRHRLIFYTHDSFGLGHFRRSLTIASYLTRHIDGLTVLMLTGVDSAASFEKPPGIDFVKLPSIWKTGADEYRSRHLRISFERVRRLRASLIHTVSRAFDPSLFIVDNVPCGMDRELLPTLRHFRRRRPEVRVALTLRDVLDEPEFLIPQWRAAGAYEALEQLYDEVWVAGCRSVFDPIGLYEIPPSVAQRLKFCGYVVRSSPPADVEALRPSFISTGGLWSWRAAEGAGTVTRCSALSSTPFARSPPPAFAPRCFSDRTCPPPSAGS